MNKIIIVAGPTASGKSTLAIKLAKMLNTDIISCDSMQIYKNMNIGTAKIPYNEMQQIKHHMIDIIEPNIEYSVNDYINTVKNIISDLHSKNKIPIICGGTGLYLDAILYPLSMGVKDKKVRDKLENELLNYGPEYMYHKLEAIDQKEAEKIHKNNTKRIIRALEIYELTGKIKSDFNDRSCNLNYEVLLLCPNIDRTKLYSKIDERVEKMFNLGLETEVKNLINSGYNFNMQSMQAIGYKEFKDYFNSNLTYDQLKELIKKNTRHYAKRQITWYKRYDFAKWVDFEDYKIIENIIDSYIKE